MDLQLSVHVRIDPDHKRVRLITAGHLTETNQQALYPLIRHARTLAADTEVVIDLTAVDDLQGAALDLLCWEVEHDDTGNSIRPVRFALTGRQAPLAPDGQSVPDRIHRLDPARPGLDHQVLQRQRSRAPPAGSPPTAEERTGDVRS